MKLPMAKNSLYSVLLRSPWWVSLGLAAALALVASATLPVAYRVAGAFSGLPFVVIAALAARRQWGLPNAAQATKTVEWVSRMPWPAFASLLEQAFVRDGYTVQRGTGDTVDFELRRQGRTMLVSARRWKSARIGLDALRALQTAREAADASDALFIGLGDLTDTARPFAAQLRIAVWQGAELAQKLHGLTSKVKESA